ncbi:hypothetical protein M434DRAFT_37508 [Hypoxylon sp. CO27-5]|nr:hypothetical protein M434DRAFT_37508 [Hypoxylon sp. CO27-5]
MTSQQNPEDVPAAPPPPGVISNFVNPPSLHAATVGVGVTTMVLLTLFIGIRTYTKSWIMKDFQHEDYFAIVAWIGLIAWAAIYIYLSAIGLTRDLWNIRAVDMSHMLYLMNVFQVIYPPTMLAAKYFILIQLRRIFCPTRARNPVWWVLHGLAVANILYYIACFFTFLFQCVPREKIWNPTVDGTCIDNDAATVVAGVLNLTLDVGIFITPIWAIWLLQMPMKRKLGVLSLFGVGLFTCTIAALGVAYRVPLTTDADTTHAIAVVGLWTYAELVGTILVGCMPMFPRFYDHLQKVQLHVQFPNLRFSTKNLVSDNSKRIDASDPKSTERITVSAHFSENTMQHTEYYELRDGNQGSTKWRSLEAV